MLLYLVHKYTYFLMGRRFILCQLQKVVLVCLSCHAKNTCKILLFSPPPHFSHFLPPLGIIVASALIDISQQKPTDFKDKSQVLKNRKALPPAHQGTCVWGSTRQSIWSLFIPSEVILFQHAAGPSWRPFQRQDTATCRRFNLAATNQVFTKTCQVPRAQHCLPLPNCSVSTGDQKQLFLHLPDPSLTDFLHTV